jgi:hypothetical protein
MNAGMAAGVSRLFGSVERLDATLIVGPGFAVYVGELPALRTLHHVVAWVADDGAGGPARVLVGGEAIVFGGRAHTTRRVVFVDPRTTAGRLLAASRGRPPSVTVPPDTPLSLRAERRGVARLFGAIGLDADALGSDAFAEMAACIELRALAPVHTRVGGSASHLPGGRRHPLPRALGAMGLSVPVAADWYRFGAPVAASSAGVPDDELVSHFREGGVTTASHFWGRIGLADQRPAHVGLVFGSEKIAVPEGSGRVVIREWKAR